jgi:hypothetical protein
MPEDEDFGEPLRLETLHNGIRTDPFMILGKPGMTFPENKSESIILDFEAAMVTALEKISLPEFPED